MASKSFFSHQVTGLSNGVSTQPDLVKLGNQAEEQINFVSSIARGLETRNGTELITSLEPIDTSINANSFITKIDKNNKASATDVNAVTDDYILVFTDSASKPIEVYNKDGVKQTVLYGSSSAGGSNTNTYVATTTPRQSIRTAVIEDYVIVSNAEKVTSMKTNATTNTNNGQTAIISVEGNPTANFDIFIKQGAAAVQTCTTTGITSSSTFVQIASAIKTAIEANASLTNLTITTDDNIVKITHDTDILTQDIYVRKDIELEINVINQNVSSAAALPKLGGYDGYVLNVVGVDEQNTLANYYVSWNASKQIWEEALEPGLDFEIDPDTMPHFLIRTGAPNSDGVAEFSFVVSGDTGLSNQRSAQSYANRLVGDDDSNPIPSFIGKSIIDVQFFRNRLVYLGQDSVVMSKSNDYFNLFASSAIINNSDNPIDIFLGSNFSVRPKYMEVYGNGLIVFTENQQFLVNSSAEALSPSTVRTELITSYSVDEDVRPEKLGSNVYFADNIGANAVIRKYVVKDDNLVKDAIEITAHVDTYIPKDIKYMTSISNKNMIFLGTVSEPKNIYVYSYYESNKKQLQSAWSKFNFNADIFGAVVFDNTIYLVENSGLNINIAKLDLFDYSSQLQIDQKVFKDNPNYTITEDNTTEVTKFDLPFRAELDNSLLAVATVNNELKQIFPTQLLEANNPDSSLGETYTSTIGVPELTSYVPSDIILSNSYIDDYNGTYNESIDANSSNDKAYKLATGTKKLIDYNSDTNRYEIKGLGDDGRFPDFVSQASRGSNTYTRIVGGILPSQEIDSLTDTNTWHLNLNFNGTESIRKAMLEFKGNGVAGVQGNYVKIPAVTLSSLNEFTTNLKIYLSSESRDNVSVLSLGGNRQASNERINIYRDRNTKNAVLEIYKNSTRNKFFIDNLFNNAWNDIIITWYYGIISVTNHGVNLPLFDRSILDSGDRVVIDRIDLANSLTPSSATSVSYIGNEDGASVQLKGYISQFKHSENKTNGKLTFNGASTTRVEDLDTVNAAIALDEHTLGDKFNLTVRGTFDSTTSDNSVIYCNKKDTQGFDSKGTFAIQKDGNTSWTKLKFIPTSSTAHKVFEEIDDTINYFWVHGGTIGQKITGLAVTHTAANTGVPIDWGDDTSNILSSGIITSHTYTTAFEPQYIDGSESLYFDNLWTGIEKRLDVDYNDGTVKVYLDNVQQTLYDSDKATPKDTITNYENFRTASLDSKIMSTDIYTINNSVTVQGDRPTSVQEVSSKGSLNHFKLVTTDIFGNKNNVFDIRFQDGSGTSVVDFYSSSTYNILGSISSYAWVANSETNNDIFNYNFVDNLEEEPTASVDIVNTREGSRAKDDSSNNYHGTVVINQLSKYTDVWVTPPNITYYGRVLFFGYPVESSYTLSPYFLQVQNKNYPTGRLNLKSIDISFQDAVNFSLEVKTKGRETYEKQFTGKVGLVSSDVPQKESGIHKFGVNSNTENLTLTLKNNSPYRSQFVGIAYEGTYINRSKIKYGGKVN
tara:strand:+ start:1243 stop:5757 length:4515 start_codon:yes stop_codon:yes gene_type:complete